MPSSFTVSAVIPASPREIYDAWLDGKTHARMTGTETAKGSSKVGAAHRAWDGYIEGRNVKLVPGQRIVQSWRTTEFTATDADSQIDVRLAKAVHGTRLTLTHSNVPDGHDGYRGGWVTHYFVPMKAYFAAHAKAATKPKPRSKAKAKTKIAAQAKPKAKSKPPAKTARKTAKKGRR